MYSVSIIAHIGHTVSRARARWVRNDFGHTLIFDESGPYAGTVTCLSGSGFIVG